MSIDNWTPDNLPVLFQGRSLLTATRREAFTIGKARLTGDDDAAVIALDDSLEREWERVNDAVERGAYGFNAKAPHPFIADRATMQNRYEVAAPWLEDFLGETPWQATFYFPSKLRNNRVGTGVYGDGRLTYRVLYEALCNGYNKGRRFIEEYFLSVFQEHMRSSFEIAVHDLQRRIMDEVNRKRKSKKAYLRNFDEWTSPMTKETFARLERETKADIIAALRNGQISLAKRMVEPGTLAQRVKLGIGGDKMFYATGRLIEHIQVKIILLSQETAGRAGKTYRGRIPF